VPGDGGSCGVEPSIVSPTAAIEIVRRSGAGAGGVVVTGIVVVAVTGACGTAGAAASLTPDTSEWAPKPTARETAHKHGTAMMRAHRRGRRRRRAYASVRSTLHYHRPP
jgi:hypothetical protein